MIFRIESNYLLYLIQSLVIIRKLVLPLANVFWKVPSARQFERACLKTSLKSEEGEGLPRW